MRIETKSNELDNLQKGLPKLFCPQCGRRAKETEIMPLGPAWQGGHIVCARCNGTSDVRFSTRGALYKE